MERNTLGEKENTLIEKKNTRQKEILKTKKNNRRKLLTKPSL